MANVRCGNSFYVDSASVATSGGSYVAGKQTGVTSILFTPDASGDSVTLCDLNPSGNGAGATKLVIKGSTAKESKFLNLYDYPMLFPNGIWVSDISSGGTATITYYTNSG